MNFGEGCHSWVLAALVMAQCLGFRVWGLGFRVYDSEIRVCGFGFGVWGLRFRV